MALPQPKVLNLHVGYHAVLHLDIHLHNVAALGVADLADAVGVIHLADVARVLKMVS